MMTTQPVTLTRRTPNQSLAIRERVNEMAGAMQTTIDQIFFRSKDAPYHIRFRSYRLVTRPGRGAYLCYWVDERRLYHIGLDQLRHARLTERLALAVRFPVRAVQHDRYGFFYAVELQAPEVVETIEPRAPELPRNIPLDITHAPARSFSIPFGVTADGPQNIDLTQPNHALVIGTTQTGKSSWMQAALTTLCLFNTPDAVQTVILDPKGEFVHWYRTPHLFADVARDERQALRVLTAVNEEMERRRKKFEELPVRNIAQYNARAGKRLPYLAVFIDEFVDLSIMSGRAFMPLLFRIASKAGSYGIRLIAATTSPKATIVDTTLRGQFGLRLAFRCEEESHSEAAFGLGKRDAARLPNIPGRFLAQLPGQQELVLAQAYHVDDEMLSRVTDGLRSKYESAAVGQGAVTDREREIALYCLRITMGTSSARLSRNSSTFTPARWRNWRRSGTNGTGCKKPTGRGVTSRSRCARRWGGRRRR
jgi:hypothetical protein